MPDEGRGKCFVIMPFGVKTGPDGKEYDFDKVLDQLIREPVAAAGLEVVRCDRIRQPGGIHKQMLEHVAQAEVAVVDVSLANANVFYELGVRHAVRPSVTVLVKHEDSDLPFNVQDEKVILYPDLNGDLAAVRAEIKAFIEAGLQRHQPDSPVFNVLGDPRRDPKRDRLEERETYRYRLVAQPMRKLSVITGDILRRRGIDVWVNSENTNMQMARYHDRSLSAMIRYEGAAKDDNDEVVEDTIALELAEQVGPREAVTAGSVYVTGPGALARCGVKKVFHVAATHGAPGAGYSMVANIDRCVTNCLRRIDRDHADELTSIVFPMMGTGEGGADVYAVAPKLVRAAIDHFKTTPDSRIETVYFSAWNRRDLEACRSALAACRADVEPEP